MRNKHFEALKPICPRCKSTSNLSVTLELHDVSRQQGDHILEGVLRCPNTHCLSHYPIIDAVPIILPNIRQYLAENYAAICAREDFSPSIQSLVGEALGPGSNYNITRHHISSYGWDHYADMATQISFETATSTLQPGNIVRCLEAGLELLNKTPSSPMLDVGCALGRSTFELAERLDGLSLGIDISFPMLRLAQQVLRQGTLNFGLKQLGIVYHPVEIETRFPRHENVDFWLCNALSLPFQKESFGFVNALNVFDVSGSPRELLTAIGNTLCGGKQTIISTPYDWAAGVAIEKWIGGHAQHLSHEGNSEQLMREILTPGKPNAIGKLRLIAERPNYPWHVRVHSRRTAAYDTHIMVCERVSARA